MKKLILMLAVVFLLAGCDQSFTVRYNGNDASFGVPPVDPNHYTAGDEAVVLEHGALSKTNCEFDSWNTNKNGEGKPYKPGDKIIIEDDVFLYAVWK